MQGPSLFGGPWYPPKGIPDTACLPAGAGVPASIRWTPVVADSCCTPRFVPLLPQVITDKAKEMNGGKNLPLWQKAACGLTAGGLGALVGSPADLTLIRMQADSTLPPEQRRNYKGVGDAMVRTHMCCWDGLGLMWLP